MVAKQKLNVDLLMIPVQVVMVMGKGGGHCTTDDSFFTFMVWGAAIAQWICQRLPLCSPRFESQAHYQYFYPIISDLGRVEKTKNKQKEAEIGPFCITCIVGQYLIDRKDFWSNLDILYW